jgi:hypothetical protein
MFTTEPLMATSWRLYPIKDATSVVTDEGTEIRNEPFASVTVPAVVPFANMETPGIGEPSFKSVTLPVTTVFCANAGNANKHSNIKQQLTLSKFLKCIKFGLNGLLIS